MNLSRWAAVRIRMSKEQITICSSRCGEKYRAVAIWIASRVLHPHKPGLVADDSLYGCIPCLERDAGEVRVQTFEALGDPTLRSVGRLQRRGAPSSTRSAGGLRRGVPPPDPTGHVRPPVVLPEARTGGNSSRCSRASVSPHLVEQSVGVDLDTRARQRQEIGYRRDGSRLRTTYGSLALLLVEERLPSSHGEWDQLLGSADLGNNLVPVHDQYGLPPGYHGEVLAEIVLERPDPHCLHAAKVANVATSVYGWLRFLGDTTAGRTGRVGGKPWRGSAYGGGGGLDTDALKQAWAAGRAGTAGLSDPDLCRRVRASLRRSASDVTLPGVVGSSRG